MKTLSAGPKCPGMNYGPRQVFGPLGDHVIPSTCWSPHSCSAVYCLQSFDMAVLRPNDWVHLVVVTINIVKGKKNAVFDGSQKAR
jgi:hypothetical protein